jgi:hypothetical protein
MQYTCILDDTFLFLLDKKMFIQRTCSCSHSEHGIFVIGIACTYVHSQPFRIETSGHRT